MGQQLKNQNEELKIKLMELDPFTFHNETDCYRTLPDIITSDKTNKSLYQNSVPRSSPDGQEKNSLEDLKLNQDFKEIVNDNKIFLEKNRQLEESLGLMNSEFGSMEDYWQEKISDERKFYEDQITKSEEQFIELEARMKEYEDLIEKTEKGTEKDINDCSDKLSVIDERRE